MKILDTCFRIIELDGKIKGNMKVLKGMIDSNNKRDEYKELFRKTLNLVDELDFYKNQINEIENLFEINQY